VFEGAPGPVLEIEGLRVRFGAVEAVRGASLVVRRGETHCLVGESGSGKSVTALAAMGLLPRGAHRAAGAIRFEGEDVGGLSDRAMNRLRGARIGMIFQEPMTSLNPAYTVGSQMTEVYRRHRTATRAEARDHAAALLGRVGMANPGLRLGQFPHQLSGGLRQRVMIAMALLCGPDLLIADEPTTALDVTVQAGILRLLAGLQAEMGLALLLITHDLGIVARIADQVSVMYAGQVVERAPVAALFSEPSHPYTRGLLASVPVPGKTKRGEKLGSIPGTVPWIGPGFAGCAFRDRCAHAMPECAVEAPLRQRGPGHDYLCQLA
jgi:peptide/nickel transport system ATP-binding protein